MWTVALAQLRTQPRRYVSVVLAVLIGTMFLAAASLVASSAQATLRATLGATYAGADLGYTRPMATRSVTVNGTTVDLSTALWERQGPPAAVTRQVTLPGMPTPTAGSASRPASSATSRASPATAATIAAYQSRGVATRRRASSRALR